jgi:hypothetical protein
LNEKRKLIAAEEKKKDYGISEKAVEKVEKRFVPLKIDKNGHQDTNELVKSA